MAPDPPDPTRGGEGEPPGSGSVLASVALVGGGVLLLTAVAVAVASDGGDLGEGPSITVGQSLLGLVVGGLSAVVVVGMWLWWQLLRQREAGARRVRPPARPWWLRSLVTIAVLLVCVVVASWVVNHTGHHEARSAARVTPTTVNRGGHSSNQKPLGGHGVPVAFMIGAVVAIAVVTGAVIRTRNRLLAVFPDEADDDEAVDAMTDALATVAVDLEGERDPRRAVVAAYARMQTVLGAAGTRRRSTETELEFLARVLTNLGGDDDGEAARSLTGLFALARYSEHPVDETMRTEALRCVRHLQSRLSMSR